MSDKLLFIKMAGGIEPEEYTLKPCPFCGGAAEASVLGLWTVECQACGACIRGFYFRVDATEAWNTRVDGCE